VISGAIDAWKASSNWSFESLKERVGSTRVPVATSRKKVYIDDAAVVGDFSVNEVRLDEFLTDLELLPDESSTSYLMQLRLDRYFPSLLGDVELPAYFDHRQLVSCNIWIGPAGNLSWLHYDSHHNFLAQVLGRKRVILFDPKYLRELYPYSWTSRAMHFSRVEIENPDYARFPRFRDAQAYESVIEPGEMLFIPIHWWHQVFSLDKCISVNMWWEAPWRDRLRYPQLRLVRRLPKVMYSRARDFAKRQWRALKDKPPALAEP
jgi:hypothetical protein